MRAHEVADLANFPPIIVWPGGEVRTRDALISPDAALPAARMLLAGLHAQDPAGTTEMLSRLLQTWMQPRPPALAVVSEDLSASLGALGHRGRGDGMRIRRSAS